MACAQVLAETALFQCIHACFTSSCGSLPAAIRDGPARPDGEVLIRILAA